MVTQRELNAYAEAVEAFCEERDWTPFHTPKELAIGLVTESSELLELFRFLSETDAEEALEEPGFRERVGEELGDVLFFLVRFSQLYGFDPIEQGHGKLAKSEEKYPAEAFRGDNRKVL